MEHIRFVEVLTYLGSLGLVAFAAKRLWYNNKDKMGRKLPPTVGSIPIFGSLPYLPLPTEMHLWTLEKAASLGGVFSFSVGKIYTVVLASHDAIREALVQRSNDFPDRVVHLCNQLNPSAKGIIFHHYNEEFKKYNQLNLSILRDLGFGQNSMETRIHMEIEQVIKNITAYNGDSFYPLDTFHLASFNIISRMIFGKPSDESCPRDKRLLTLLGEFAKYFNSLLPMDIAPSLRFVPYFRKKIDATKVYSTEFINLIERKISEAICIPTDDCFVNSFIRREDGNPDVEQLKFTVRDLIVAGTEAVSTSVQWALIILANNQNIQKQLQIEIDSVTSRDQLPSFCNMSKTKYVEAFILELLRYKTPGTIGVPRYTMRDTTVGGYFIPKDSIVLTALYAVHRDEKFWKDPTVFRPERFLDGDGNIINRHLVITFGTGKRSCTGETMARQELYLFVTSLIQQFNILPPEGVSKIEEKDASNVVLYPCPFKVRLLPRK